MPAPPPAPFTIPSPFLPHPQSTAGLDVGWHLAGEAGGEGFVFVLLCEFSAILDPEHIVAGFEVVERLKTRNCGHAGLYKVQWAYEKGAHIPSSQSALEPLSTLTLGPSKAAAPNES